MKIAIFQNFLDTIGGAEVVGLTIARELDADIYTTNVDREKVRQMGFADVRIHSIGKVPLNAPFRQQAVLARFRFLNLKNTYDMYIINGDWAVSAAINHSPSLWYVNATIREIWDLYEHTRKNNVRPYNRYIFDAWVRYNRYLNKKHVRCVSAIASNSTFTQERVEKYLDRKSELIYPPTQTGKFSFGQSGDYWLSVNRLIAYKRVDMQMRAFAKMPERRLIVLGPYEKSVHCREYADYIHRIKPPNVTLIDQADSFEELARYYANCTGFITTCLKEDFGMTAVEAMASGKPVIAPNEGGYRETVIHGKTGILVEAMNEDSLKDAVIEISQILEKNPDKYKEASIAQARKFDVRIFTEKIRNLIKNIVSADSSEKTNPQRRKIV